MTTNQTLAALGGRVATGAEWCALLHTLANLAERQGRLDLAIKISEAADRAAPFTPYAVEGGGR